jgi:hypothetical protein
VHIRLDQDIAFFEIRWEVVPKRRAEPAVLAFVGVRDLAFGWKCVERGVELSVFVADGHTDLIVGKIEGKMLKSVTRALRARAKVFVARAIGSFRREFGLAGFVRECRGRKDEAEIQRPEGDVKKLFHRIHRKDSFRNEHVRSVGRGI